MGHFRKHLWLRTHTRDWDGGNALLWGICHTLRHYAVAAVAVIRQLRAVIFFYRAKFSTEREIRIPCWGLQFNTGLSTPLTHYSSSRSLYSNEISVAVTFVPSCAYFSTWFPIKTSDNLRQPSPRQHRPSRDHPRVAKPGNSDRGAVVTSFSFPELRRGAVGRDPGKTSRQFVEKNNTFSCYSLFGLHTLVPDTGKERSRSVLFGMLEVTLLVR